MSGHTNLGPMHISKVEDACWPPGAEPGSRVRRPPAVLVGGADAGPKQRAPSAWRRARPLVSWGSSVLGAAAPGALPAPRTPQTLVAVVTRVPARRGLALRRLLSSPAADTCPGRCSPGIGLLEAPHLLQTVATGSAYKQVAPFPKRLKITGALSGVC